MKFSYKLYKLFYLVASIITISVHAKIGSNYKAGCVPATYYASYKSNHGLSTNITFDTEMKPYAYLKKLNVNGKVCFINFTANLPVCTTSAINNPSLSQPIKTFRGDWCAFNNQHADILNSLNKIATPADLGATVVSDINALISILK